MSAIERQHAHRALALLIAGMSVSHTYLLAVLADESIDVDEIRQTKIKTATGRYVRRYYLA